MIGILIRKENTEEENKLYKNIVLKRNKQYLLIYDYDNLIVLDKKLKKCKGIILTGGYYVGRLDYYLISYCLQNSLPLLGICQGMQSMALYNTNNKLIKITNNHPYGKGHVHEVIVYESKLKNILKESKIIVNTYHHETVCDGGVFKISARSSDGLVEALESKDNLFMIGVQWHPERMNDIFNERLLEEFINCCK